MGSITQICSSTQWEHKNTGETLAIGTSLPTTPVYQQTCSESGECNNAVKVNKQKVNGEQVFSQFSPEKSESRPETKTQAWGDSGVLHG